MKPKSIAVCFTLVVRFCVACAAVSSPFIFGQHLAAQDSLEQMAPQDAPVQLAFSPVVQGSAPDDSDPANSDPANSDPANSDPANSDPANSDPANSDPANSDPANSDPANSKPNGVAVPVAGPVMEAAKNSFGRFFTVTSPIDDRMVSEVTNLALKLQSQAAREERQAVLVLEILPGSSRFGQVSDLARFLTSAACSRVHTVAWIPKTLDGNPVVLAMCCHEILMHPDASLGDIGRGVAIPSDEQDFVLSIIDRRRNVRLSRGVAHAMMAPEKSLMRVTVESPDGAAEKKFVTTEELRLLQDQNQIITRTETVKEAGTPGLFNASDALRGGFLTAATPADRLEVAALYSLPLEAMREEGIQGPLVVRLIRIDDMIEPVLGDFVLREMHKAVSEGANLIIFDIDSPGGYVHTSEELALGISELDPAKVTTVAWVRRAAISGAAVTALACDRIILHPEARLGDAGVIQETAEGGAFERANEKIFSPFLLFVGDLAKRKNRPPALLQAMVDKDLEVYQVTSSKTGKVTYMSQFEIDEAGDEWIRGNLVPESRAGLLLTVNGVRAHELGLAETPCRDLEEVRLRLGIAENVVLAPLARTWVDTLVFFLNTSFGSFLLMTVAILCLYIEVHLPSGLFGILSAVLFSLYFWSRFLGGTAGSLELILFLMGLGLLAVELFILPGFGVFGVSGILLVLGSLVMASHTFAGMTVSESFDESLGSLGALAGSLVTVVLVAVILNRFLPTIPFLNKLILTPPGYAPRDHDAPLLKPDSKEEHSFELIKQGDIGLAASVLRPSGKGQFGDHFVDVVSDGGFIEHGTQIEVIRIVGNRIIVRPSHP